MASLAYLYSLLLTLVNFDPAIFSAHQAKPEANHKALFVFGDSVFDAGNNLYIPNFTDEAAYWPYGETFFHHPNGRWCDGRIVPDFIAKFAKLPMLSPYLQPGPKNYADGINFASAAAGILVETNPKTINLGMQLSYFKNVTEVLKDQLGDEEAKRLLGNAVYLISMGGNDYFIFYYYHENCTESMQQEFVEIVIGNLTSVLQGIYDLGGRKFAFQNAGPLGCIPSARATILGTAGCIEMLQSLARKHNKALAGSLKELESRLPGFKYSIFEYYDELGDRMLNPAKYGFKDGIDACCGVGPYRASDCGGNNGTEAYELCNDPEDYLWFDGTHTNEKANLQLAELIWNGTENVTWPYNARQLFEQE